RTSSEAITSLELTSPSAQQTPPQSLREAECTDRTVDATTRTPGNSEATAPNDSTSRVPPVSAPTAPLFEVSRPRAVAKFFSLPNTTSLRLTRRRLTSTARSLAPFPRHSDSRTLTS